MIETSAAGGRAAGSARRGLIDRHDLVAALDRAAGKRVTIISAPAGSGKTSLLRAWADRPGQDRRIAFMSVKPGQHDAQLFWLALLGAVRAATGGAEPPPAPGFNGQAMVGQGAVRARGVRGAPRPDHRRPARAELRRGRRAAHGAADEPAPGRPRGRGHPPRPPAAPAPAAAGRGAGRDPRRAAALHRGRDPRAAGRRRDHAARPGRRHAAPADRGLGGRACGWPCCPWPGTPIPNGSSPSSPAATGRSPST